MHCYSKRCINIITLIITVLLFIQTNYITLKIINFNESQNLGKQIIQIDKFQISESSENLEKFQENQIINKETTWTLAIPKINITATVEEGTTQDILINYVGHFSGTPKVDGNVGLIGNNSGGINNYFENLEQLQENDIIFYKYGNNQKQYKVTKNIIIKDTDWSYLQNSEQNKITLITGAKTNKNERRCVQAIEV